MKNSAYFCLFTDICGNLKEKVVYECDFNTLFQSNIHFDGSSIKGFSSTRNSDLKLKLDSNGVYKNNIIFCDVCHSADARSALKKTIKKAKQLGYEVKAGAELEFYFFRKTNNKANLLTRDNKLYMSPCSLRIKNINNLIASKLEELDITLESIHHEASNNQYEITFKFGDPVKIADEVTLIKQTLKQVAEENNCYVCFMPKPFSNSAGSGMHTNLSIYKDGKNLFSKKNSKVLEWFSNGIMNHAKAITAVTCPSINSYKRLNASTECPTKIFMSKHDRTALIRLPMSSGDSARIEVRSPDISCNPYLCFAMLIESGINGIVNKEKCDAINSRLPKTLSEAIFELKSDEYLTRKFSKIIRNYIKVKQNELDEFNSFITDFEKGDYL